LHHYQGSEVKNDVIFAGLTVRAFVRDVDKIPEEIKPQVEPFKGDVVNIEDVRKGVEGQDAVIVALGTRNNLGT
jgi:putative NADH-flavin reductase